VSALRERECLSVLRESVSVCIKIEVCLHWDREGVFALRQRGWVSIKTEKVRLH